MLSEINQAEKDKYCMASLKCAILKVLVNIIKRRQTHGYKE